MREKGTLVFFCGKMGAGKSTQARLIATEQNAVLLSEDEWLSSLYPQQIASFADYLKYSAQLKPLVKAHVQHILATGTNVVMDFPANTRAQRQWFLALAAEIKAQHRLVYLDVSDAQCLQQIGQRRTEQPERAAFDTEAMFKQVTHYFEAPSSSEGLNIL
ncbi:MULTISPECIES: AAA family ATPase [Shewanella]|uniref:ATP-binding protein n=1 Tax=Shewanella salipaludis TaxID=2723052 RepID=A0A972FQ08_9GAMM|nr:MULTISPECIES: ATP-binding protein [Shewanella]MCE9688252.1 ATP-binding protein [Shewanella sp. AS16]NMH63642.1 ATP-binding protein [Shewanella salipaludis]